MSFPSTLAVQAPTLLAYLDPGTGSMFLQLALAGLLSGMFALKSASVQVRAAVQRLLPVRARS
jgi:hypothetical protein